jgi:hypothetical protein
MLAAAMDDGLGAFRPSTSFNDFTALLVASPAAVESSATVTPNTVSAESMTQEIGRKRVIGEGAKTGPKGPVTKKRATSSKPSSPGGPKPTIKPMTVISGVTKIVPHSGAQDASMLRKDQPTSLNSHKCRANTPNPLSFTAPSAPPVATRPTPVKLSVGGTVGASRQVVSPPSVVVINKVDPIQSAAVVATTMPPRVASPSLATEADFVAVAQAAVTNLILNAGANVKIEGVPSKSDSAKKVVDVSTAHIKALTSTNWVTACSGSGGSVESDSAADSKSNRARRQNLNPDERARQNRDRNREHARNTRLRKKAYVEELKRTLTELVSQRDSAEFEKRHSVQREIEQREVRFRVMEEFLKLRGRNEPNFARWIAILEEGFSLTLPFTTFRAMSESKSEESRTSGRAIEQSFEGAAEVMGDARSISAFLQTLGNENTTYASATPITLSYNCDRKNFFMDGCSGVLLWSATSVGAVNNVRVFVLTFLIVLDVGAMNSLTPRYYLFHVMFQGAPYELFVKGNMRANFSPASNKLISAEIQFDTGSVVDQLQDLIVPKIDDEHLGSDLCDGVATAAAQAALNAAANEADALLDSLQMPQLDASVPSAISVASGSSAAVSVTSSEKSDCSSDESIEEGKQDSSGNSSALSRRSLRRKD